MSDPADGGDGPLEARSAGSPITVALIEDNRLVREGLTALLSRVPDIRVLPGEPGSSLWTSEGLALDVILLDLGLDTGGSVGVAQAVVKEFPGTRVIVMDLLPSEEDMLEFVAVGVSGFVMKDAVLDELLMTIRAVAAGEDVLPRPLVNTLFAEIAKELHSSVGPSVSSAVRLTSREREVLDLIGDGMSNKAIGKSLHISTHTVKSHLRNIMEKLNLHSRLQLAVYQHGEESAS